MWSFVINKNTSEIGFKNTEVVSPRSVRNKVTVIRVGWLMKQGELRKTWYKRYCILLSSSKLIYFTDCDCVDHRGTANFDDVRNVGIYPHEPNKFFIVTPSRQWEFETSSPDDASQWLRAIQTMSQGENTRDETAIRRKSLAIHISSLETTYIGWLVKRGEINTNWNSRYCILLPNRLMIYFTDSSCSVYKGRADFRNDIIVTRDSDPNKPNYFTVDTDARLWHFMCENIQDSIDWMKVLNRMKIPTKGTKEELFTKQLTELKEALANCESQRFMVENKLKETEITLAETQKKLQQQMELNNSKYKSLNNEDRLLEASKRNNFHEVKMMRVNVNWKDENGLTALHWAVRSRSIETIKELLQFVSLDINAVDHHQRTALHDAVESGSIEIVKILISHKDIQINSLDEKHLSALDYAQLQNNKTIEQILIETGAKFSNENGEEI